MLIIAAKEGDLVRVKMEIEGGTDIDTIDIDGYTALIWVSDYFCNNCAVLV